MTDVADQHQPANGNVPAPAVVVCGTSAIDMIGHYARPFAGVVAGQGLNVSMQLDRFTQEFGGCAMNICYTLSLLGARALPIARVGLDFNDGYGQHLARHGIDASGILIDERFAYSSRCVILSDAHGNQLTAFYPGSSAASASRYRPHIDAGEFARQQHCALGVVAPDVPETMIRHALLLAAAGVPFITDPGQGLADFSASELGELLVCTRRLIVNAMEWRTVRTLLAAADDEILQQLAWLVITHGGDGIELRRPHAAPLMIAAVPPRAYVDHTGCGDALRAGLAFGLASGIAIEDALRIGALAATFNLEVAGCQRHQFTRAEFAARYVAEFSRPWPLPS